MYCTLLTLLHTLRISTLQYLVAVIPCVCVRETRTAQPAATLLADKKDLFRPSSPYGWGGGGGGGGWPWWRSWWK